MGKRKKSPPAKTPSSSRKEYAAPRLTEYGDLRKIVMGVTKASNRNDGGGAPATKR